MGEKWVKKIGVEIGSPRVFVDTVNIRLTKGYTQ